MDDFKEIPSPKPPTSMATAASLASGPPIAPLSHVILYSADEWEGFIEEWLYLCVADKYVQIRKSSGANDKGIDVAAYSDDKKLKGVWDNYQCKHYDNSIAPNEVWIEFGKILWFSFKGHYLPPRKYYFVAPKDIGSSLSQLLGNPENLKKGIEENWNKYCAEKITKSEKITLDREFKKYFDLFDFSMFDFIPAREVIEDYRKTPYFSGRFGLNLPSRPIPSKPPGEISSIEAKYVGKLFDAYSDYTKNKIIKSENLSKWPKLSEHFKRQREAFYHAESLRIFVRDKVEPGTFESLQEEIYTGVIDTHDQAHPDGYERVTEVIKASQEISLDAHPLSKSAFTKDKHGICHQLANEDRLKWID